MRVLIVILSALFALASCSTDSSNPTIVQVEDSIEAIEEDSLVIEIVPEIDSFALLIEAPEDILKYKSRKLGANNGSARAHDFYYKPDSVGFYYKFLLFHRMPSNLKGPDWFDGLRVVVYRFGNKIGHYGDTNECFISLKAKVQEPDLRSFNLVGQPIVKIKEKFGDDYMTKDQLMIYSSTNKVLLIHVDKEKVDWFKYVILKDDFAKLTDLPAALINY